jgi:hypothetical protein
MPSSAVASANDPPAQAGLMQLLSCSSSSSRGVRKCTVWVSCVGVARTAQRGGRQWCRPGSRRVQAQRGGQYALPKGRGAAGRARLLQPAAPAGGAGMEPARCSGAGGARRASPASPAATAGGCPSYAAQRQ